MPETVVGTGETFGVIPTPTVHAQPECGHATGRDAGESIAVYRGVPTGRFRIVEVPVEGWADLPAETRMAFGISDDGTSLDARDFQPTAAYSSIADVIRLDNLARHTLGFLGPVADPQSDIRGRDAMEPAGAVCRGIELRDVLGHLVSGRVWHISQRDVAEGFEVQLSVRFDQGSAGVAARLRDRSMRGDGHDTGAA